MPEAGTGRAKVFALTAADTGLPLRPICAWDEPTPGDFNPPLHTVPALSEVAVAGCRAPVFARLGLAEHAPLAGEAVTAPRGVLPAGGVAMAVQATCCGDPPSDFMLLLQHSGLRSVAASVTVRPAAVPPCMHPSPLLKRLLPPSPISSAAKLSLRVCP